MKKDLNKRAVFNIALVLYLIIYLSFVLNTGYWSDDRKYEFLKGIMLSNQWSLLDYFKFRWGVHLNQFGRFFPITSMLAEGFPFLLGLKFYKIYLVLVTVSAAFLFRYFIKLLTDSDKIADLTLILSVILFSVQHGMPHAVFLCMGGNAIVCMMLLLICFCCILLNCKNYKIKYEVAAVVSFMLSMLTYEAAYPFIAVIAALLLFRERKIGKALRCIIPYLTIWLIMVGIYAALGNLSQNTEPGVNMNFDMIKIMKGFVVSVTAPLPFVTWHFRSGAPDDLLSFFQNIVWKDIVLVLGFIGIYLSVIKKKTFGKSKTMRFKLTAVGILFIALPAVLMGVSGKYQMLPLGNGYQVIIFQYFGWGCLGAAVTDFFMSWFTTRYKRGKLPLVVFHTIVVFGASILILVNQQDSRWTIKELELYEPSVSAGFDISLRNAFQDGMIEEMGLDSETVMFAMKRDYYNIYNRSAMFAETAGQVYPVYWLEEMDKSLISSKRCYGLNSGDGWVMMGELNSINEANTEALVDDVWLYCDKKFDKLMINTKHGPEFVDFAKAEVVKQGLNGTLYRFQSIQGNMNEMEPTVYVTYSLGTVVPASLTQEDKGIYVMNGFGIRENRFAWTDDKVLNIYLELEQNNFDEILAEFSLNRIYADEQQVNVWVNDVECYSEKLVNIEMLRFSFKKPEDNIVRLRMEFPEAISPIESGALTDERELGIAVRDYVMSGIKND